MKFKYTHTNGKKGQEEILGFVLIILLVVVAGVILLAMQLNKPAEDIKSIEARNLLEATLAYTTDCAVRYVPEYSSVKDLIGNCYSGYDCSNLNKGSCMVLNDTLNNLLSSGLEKEFESGKINSYSFDIKGEDNSTIISLSKGNCAKSLAYGAYQPLDTNNGKVNLFFKLCYSNLSNQA